MRKRDLERRKAAAFARSIAALNNADADVRYDAAVALATMGDTAAIPYLANTLSGDGDYWVRAVAAKALGELGDPAAIPSLEAALGDEDHRVRWAAAEALRKLGRTND